MTRIGVFGPKGRLGRWLVQMGAEPVECDITDFKSIVDALSGKEFDVLINCAAYTQVDDAEKKENEKVVTWTNHKSITFILAALSLKTHFVHMSTDYVFGGKRGPYNEKVKFIKSDLPVNFYGLSKMAAEASLVDIPRVTIVRTTGLFGSGEPDFVTSVISHLEGHNTMIVSNNLRGNQTYIPFLAEQLLQLCQMENKPPLIHLASRDILSRYDFACDISRLMGYSDIFLQPAPSNLIWDVPRPVLGGLLVLKSKELGFRIYSAEEGLVAYLKRIGK